MPYLQNYCPTTYPILHIYVKVKSTFFSNFKDVLISDSHLLSKFSANQYYTKYSMQLFCLNSNIFRAREKSQFKLRNSTKVRRYQHVLHICNCAKLFSLLAETLFMVQVWRH